MKPNIKVGRRKCAVARVFLVPGTGKVTVNKKDLSAFFTIQYLCDAVLSPLKLVNVEDKYDVRVNVNGGGIKGQAEAIRMGIARALDAENAEENHTPLKAAGMLTRDSRIVERKKPGLLKARRRSQFSKR
jgi:small subunit ribosomal protein S9